MLFSLILNSSFSSSITSSCLFLNNRNERPDCTNECKLIYHNKSFEMIVQCMNDILINKNKERERKKIL